MSLNRTAKIKADGYDHDKIANLLTKGVEPEFIAERMGCPIRTVGLVAKKMVEAQNKKA